MARASKIIVPGDKSITHRGLLLAALSRGQSRIDGALASLDTRSTARVLRAVGVEITPLRAGTVRVTGRTRFRSPGRALNCGNSGTTARLGLGLLAAHPIRAVLTGDRSLRRRPMRRVTEPLERMGAHFEPALADRLPISVRGGRLESIRWELPVSSAQLKSALLLAGLAGDVAVAVREPAGRSRDHTERMLRALGYPIAERDGWIELAAGGPVPPFELRVPGDPSSAAFLVGAALIGAAGAITVDRVGMNPTRTGFLDVARRMGGRIAVDVTGEELGEPVGMIGAEPGPLRRTVVGPAEIPGLIDEIPMLAVLAARADGESRFEEVGELRVKESDRLGLLAANLRALGYEADAFANTLRVRGRDHPPRGRVRTDGDHRLAMAFSVLGAVPGARVSVDDRDCVAVSFPGFFDLLRQVRARR